MNGRDHPRFRRARRAAAVGLVVALAFVPEAVSQAPTCEDSLKAMRALAEQLSISRQRGEADTAQLIAALQKQIEALRAQVQALEAEKKAAAPKPGAPAGAR